MGTRFGDLVAQRRASFGITSQAALARATGLSSQTIMDIEGGKTENPSVVNALKICLALEITPAEMAECFGMWHGKPLENDRLDRQLAFTLSNLEDIAQGLGDGEQARLDETLDMVVQKYRAGKQKRIVAIR